MHVLLKEQQHKIIGANTRSFTLTKDAFRRLLQSWEKEEKKYEKIPYGPESWW
jgi:hypothetical protein